MPAVASVLEPRPLFARGEAAPRFLRSKNLRFTLDGSTELEQHLAGTCAKIAAGIRGLIPRGKLEAILLGGGYGRGEGGVLTTPTGERPYNDLEFYVCVRGNRHLNELRFGRALHVLGEILTPQAGLDVEFKITSIAELADGAVSMFSYDLITGHRRVFGGGDWLTRCVHHTDAARIPLNEATRLLMNRCSGLLVAKEKLWKPEFTAADADFVHRNIAKARLALGDALLVAHGRYHWSVRERAVQLEQLAADEKLPWLDEVRQEHGVGAEFKLHPERSTASRGALLTEQERVSVLALKVWLWIEELRLGVDFGSARNYAESKTNKWRTSSALRNAVLSVRALGAGSLSGPRIARHPRERILNALSLLLWEPASLRDPHLLAMIQRELQTRGRTLAEIMPAYRELWSRVS